MLGGGLGAGLPWYWDNYINAQNLYTHFSALAKFASGLSFVRDNYVVATARISDGRLRAAVLQSADSSRIAGWVLNRDYNWKTVKSSGAPAAIAGATITLSAIKNGVYMVRWLDCHTGAPVLATTVTVTGQELRLVCPTVAWDLSVVMEAVR
jgi:hypothetical protein